MTILFPLKFAPLKRASSRSPNALKLKGKEKMLRMNKKRQIYSKIRVRENERGGNSEGALKLEARKLKARNLKGRKF